jgi:hypothetical protein
MDPTLQAKIDEAKANGYSDEEINAYINSQTTPQPQQGLGAPDRSSEYYGLAQGMGANALGSAIEYGAPAAAAYYGVKKLMENYKGPGSSAASMPAQQAVQTAAQGTGTYGAGPKTPNLRVAPPSNPNAGAQAFDQMSRQLSTSQPVQSAMQQSQAPSMLQRGMDYASKMRQIAAEKVIQNAGTLAKTGMGISAMTYSAPLGPQVPNQGPYRGMEINPMSGRPWTPQELAQINR